MLRAMPPEVELVYFGDPKAPVRPAGDRVLGAASMAYQPSLKNKLKMLGHMAGLGMGKLPLHGFFAPNRTSAATLDILRRVRPSRPVMQTLPASTGCQSIARLLARLDRVVVTSDWGREQLVASGIAPGHIARVYPGVAMPDSPPGPPVGQRRHVLFAGDLEREVGDRLIDVASAMAGLDDWILEIATRPKGDEHEAVRARLIRALGPAIEAGRVTIAGEVSSINELFDRAAVQLYLASHARNKVDIPFVLLEGMARGVPVAVVDAQPVGELLTLGRRQDLEVGVSLDPSRFRESAEDILALLRDAGRIERLGRAARQLTGDCFSDTEMAAGYRRQYEELS